MRDEDEGLGLDANISIFPVIRWFAGAALLHC